MNNDAEDLFFECYCDDQYVLDESAHLIIVLAVPFSWEMSLIC